MIDIDIRVYADEVVLRLDRFPKKIRAAMREKFETAIFPHVKSEIFGKTPGEFFDPEYIKTGVDDIGSSTVVGYVEAEQKPGTYPIVPVKAKLLKFLARDGTWVRTKLVHHPYMKTAAVVERRLLEMKPWLERQMREAVEEAGRR